MEVCLWNLKKIIKFNTWMILNHKWENKVLRNHHRNRQERINLNLLVSLEEWQGGKEKIKSDTWTRHLESIRHITTRKPISIYLCNLCRFNKTHKILGLIYLQKIKWRPGLTKIKNKQISNLCKITIGQFYKIALQLLHLNSIIVYRIQLTIVRRNILWVMMS